MVHVCKVGVDKFRFYMRDIASNHTNGVTGRWRNASFSEQAWFTTSSLGNGEERPLCDEPIRMQGSHTLRSKGDGDSFLGLFFLSLARRRFGVPCTIVC